MKRIRWTAELPWEGGSEGAKGGTVRREGGRERRAGGIERDREKERLL